jgi:hypothetical protein
MADKPKEHDQKQADKTVVTNKQKAEHVRTTKRAA